MGRDLDGLFQSLKDRCSHATMSLLCGVVRKLSLYDRCSFSPSNAPKVPSMEENTGT